tara:strand:- start:592 stop:1440 length:849 start_codon:yes stop_codon:yes gene_type:complete
MLGLGSNLVLGGVISAFNNFSIDVDGNSDFINLGNSSTIKLTTIDTSEGDGFTVAFWCKADDWNVTSPTSGIVGCFQASGGWVIEWTTRVEFTLRSNSANNKTKSAYKPFESEADAHYRASGWHLFVGTFDGRYQNLYVDGALTTGGGAIPTVDIGSDDNAIEYATGNDNVDVLIGADPAPLTGGVSGTSAGGAFFPGLIDEVAMWNKALDADAVKEMFDAVDVDGVPLDLTKNTGDYDYSSGLIGYWRMEEGTGSTVADSSSNSTTGTLKGTAAFSTTIPS